MTLELLLVAALAIAAVLVVALPFLRDPAPSSDTLDELDEHERRRLERLETRDRALAALKELEFDHRTGTISDEDYRQLVGPLRGEVARALQALGDVARGGAAEDEHGEGQELGGRTR